MAVCNIGWDKQYTGDICSLYTSMNFQPRMSLVPHRFYWSGWMTSWRQTTVYPKKYAHGFVVLCFVVVMQSFILNSHEVFIHIHQGCFAGTGAIVRLPQCQWSKPDGYGKISQCITTTKHRKAKTVCIFLGICCSFAHLSLYSKYYTKTRCNKFATTWCFTETTNRNGSICNRNIIEGYLSRWISVSDRSKVTFWRIKL